MMVASGQNNTYVLLIIFSFEIVLHPFSILPLPHEIQLKICKIQEKYGGSIEFLKMNSSEQFSD